MPIQSILEGWVAEEEGSGRGYALETSEKRINLSSYLCHSDS